MRWIKQNLETIWYQLGDRTFRNHLVLIEYRYHIFLSWKFMTFAELVRKYVPLAQHFEFSMYARHRQTIFVNKKLWILTSFDQLASICIQMVKLILHLLRQRPVVFKCPSLHWPTIGEFSSTIQALVSLWQIFAGWWCRPVTETNAEFLSINIFPRKYLWIFLLRFQPQCVKLEWPPCQHACYVFLHVPHHYQVSIINHTIIPRVPGLRTSLHCEWICQLS